MGVRLRTARALAWASLAGNALLVLSGGAVRLTESGLGCPTWPQCTEESLVPHGELGLHGAIEFGNRLLGVALALVAIATWVAVLRLRTAAGRARRTATLLALGVPAQALLGGVTVLTDLNPWMVACHLMLSMALIALAVLLIRQLARPLPLAAVPAPAVWLVRVLYATCWVVLYAGTVVTGSGPHAGDAASPRNGLDPASVSQAHADLVFLLVGLTVGAVFALRASGAPDALVRAATTLLAVELAQGAIGLVQYATDLPLALVAAHLLGASVLTAVATWLWLATESAHRSLPGTTTAQVPVTPRQGVRTGGGDV
ncbi:MAG TPA: COX15/CtaA family protein [Nocardioidaceae bacterium]|jgi:cytochrome c oxidase assembly protein subunit 15|nr:COX15/CtaA family protein [Nocardioidaceae bacterium]